MKSITLFAASLAAAFLSSAVAAQQPSSAVAATDIKRNQMVYSSDGKRIGKIHAFRRNGDGSSTALVIYEQRFLAIPVSTITTGARGLVTSMTREQVRGSR